MYHPANRSDGQEDTEGRLHARVQEGGRAVGAGRAAAIDCGADVIVTANLRDFPVSALFAYKIEPQHPDTFLLSLIVAKPEEVKATLRQMRRAI